MKRAAEVVLQRVRLSTSSPSTLRGTKIVATIGPSSSTKEVLSRLVTAGVDCVRLNFSHGKAEEHLARAAIIREISGEIGREIAIMADLQGPKIRVGKFEKGSVMLAQGQRFVLDAARAELGDERGVGLDYRDLPKDVSEGTVLLLNDGLIELVVDRVEGNKVHTTVVQGGELGNNKGINKVGGGLTAPALTDKDKADIVTAVTARADYIAVSFPKTAADMEEARELVRVACRAQGVSREPGLVSKIERTEAIHNLEAIILASDGIMVARGDLGVEVGQAKVPGLQKRMIKLARQHDRFVITATQMMESMINASSPTRAEVSDVANAVEDGTDAVMLSAETAAGHFPVETVQWMAKICVQAETDISSESGQGAPHPSAAKCPIDMATARGAVSLAKIARCKALATITWSGSTALWMSRGPSFLPIVAATDQIETLRRVAVLRNVHGLMVPSIADRSAVVPLIIEFLGKDKVIVPGSKDRIVVTFGDKSHQAAGATNALTIIEA